MRDSDMVFVSFCLIVAAWAFVRLCREVRALRGSVDRMLHVSEEWPDERIRDRIRKDRIVAEAEYRSMAQGQMGKEFRR